MKSHETVFWSFMKLLLPFRCKLQPHEVHCGKEFILLTSDEMSSGAKAIWTSEVAHNFADGGLNSDFSATLKVHLTSLPMLHTWIMAPLKKKTTNKQKIPSICTEYCFSGLLGNWALEPEPLHPHYAQRGSKHTHANWCYCGGRPPNALCRAARHSSCKRIPSMPPPPRKNKTSAANWLE